MRRSRLILLIAAVLVLFLLVSAGLARIFNAQGSERTAVTNLIDAEARGDRAGVMARISGCSASAACRARVATDVEALRRPGKVSVLGYGAATGFGLGGSGGTARIAWEIINSTRPIVQCVRVKRTGNVVSGFRLALLEISPRIPSGKVCPKRY
jgi:hypothetical protein